MQLSLHHNQHQNAITSCDERGIGLRADFYQTSLIVGRHSLHSDWPVTTLSEINMDNLQVVIAARPDILLIGTGVRQQLPSVPLLQALLRYNIAAEFMHTAAACRTFNVLLGEDREVMAALIWDQSPEP